MKKYTFLYIATAMLGLTSCNETDLTPGRQGRLVLEPKIESGVQVVSRAVDTDALNESLIVWVSNSRGVVRKYNGASAIPAEEYLLTGSYVAEAWAGDSVSASFDKQWYKGKADFEIVGQQTTQVTIPCKIANVLVEVTYGADFEKDFTSYSMTVGHRRGSLTFEGADTRTGYFMMPSNDKDLEWTLTATSIDGVKVTRSGKIANAAAATKYVLNVHYDPVPETIGGAFTEIIVDTTEEEIYDDVTIELPPMIQGVGFDITKPYFSKAGSVDRKSAFITACGRMKRITMQYDGLGALLAAGNAELTSVNQIDFVNASAELIAAVDAVGINATINYDETENITVARVNFEPSLLNNLLDGEYSFAIMAEDQKSRSAQVTLQINISDVPLRVDNFSNADVWAKSATLRAQSNRVDVGTVTFEYRKVGDDAWTSVPAVVTGTSLSAEISVNPATNYEYRARTDVDNFVSDIVKFTTESASQLPNAGFEEWNTSNKSYLLAKDAASKFWDSGNQGASSLGNSITVPDNSIKHSGEYSVKMTSQFIGMFGIGKFAAGNAFIGEYLYTDGTDGVLGWGRAFTSRPKAVKAYVKYAPGQVSYECQYIKKGETDKGRIFIALLDDSTKDAGTVDSGKSSVWPVVIKTKTAQLFSNTDPNVIAFGEIVFDEATAGDGLIEITIPIEYYRTDIKPSNIMMTLTASYYGDYFAGGNSTLWVDDIELIY